jgi:hypothetical protein
MWAEIAEVFATTPVLSFTTHRVKFVRSSHIKECAVRIINPDKIKKETHIKMK